jgi:hypothetical protein
VQSSTVTVKPTFFLISVVSLAGTRNSLDAPQGCEYQCLVFSRKGLVGRVPRL